MNNSNKTLLNIIVFTLPLWCLLGMIRKDDIDLSNITIWFVTLLAASIFVSYLSYILSAPCNNKIKKESDLSYPKICIKIINIIEPGIQYFANSLIFFGLFNILAIIIFISLKLFDQSNESISTNIASILSYSLVVIVIASAFMTHCYILNRLKVKKGV